jgi:pimeloyl-ACP methyl ester carboxylesterase
VRQEPCENDSNFIDAFDQGAKANREALRQKGKLEIPVLAVYGALSNTGAGAEEMMCELANRVFSFVFVSPDAARWVAEENSRVFVDSLLSFLKATR